MPDSCEPTSTVVTACSDPVATMRRVIGPSVTGAVDTCNCGRDRSSWKATAPAISVKISDKA